MDLISSLLASVLPIIVTSSLSARWAVRNFQNSKWWEKKENVYQDLIEGLYDMHAAQSAYMDEMEDSGRDDRMTEEQRTVAAEKSKRLWESYRKGKEELQRLAVIGTFIASPKVLADVAALETAVMRAQKENDAWDHYAQASDTCAALQTCINSVREHAMEDLGLKRPPILLWARLRRSSRFDQKKLPSGS